MSFFPFVNPPLVENIANDLPLYSEIAWDFDRNVPIIENGEFKVVEGIEAIKVWVYKALNTNRFQHLIYTWDYGSEISNLIGGKYTRDFTEMEAKRYIEECLEINPYITNIEVQSISFENDNLSINAQIETIYGVSEVIM